MHALGLHVNKCNFCCIFHLNNGAKPPNLRVGSAKCRVRDGAVGHCGVMVWRRSGVVALWRGGAAVWWRGPHLEVVEVAEVLDLLDDVVVQLQLDQLVEADEVVNLEDVLV